MPRSRLCMDEDTTTNRTKWSFVEVEGPLEKFPRTNPWIERGLTEKIEGEFSLWQKKVPKVWWRCGVDAGKNCKEVVLERGNSVFSPVSAMHVWWDKLEFCVPLEGYCFLVCRTGLIVKNLEVYQETPCCQACHNGIVGCNSMVVTFELECLLEEEIAINVDGNHDVLVPRACPDRKAGSVVCVQPAEGVHLDEDLIGQHILGTRGSGGQCWR
jgi:hypothetical protein